MFVSCKVMSSKRRNRNRGNRDGGNRLDKIKAVLSKTYSHHYRAQPPSEIINLPREYLFLKCVFQTPAEHVSFVN